MVYHKVLTWDLFVLVSLSMTVHYTRKMYAYCDMIADDTTLLTSGKDILQTRSNMQYSLDQVSSWCDNNDMVINPTKNNRYQAETPAVTLTARSHFKWGEN